jgi:hypothetical protein
MIQQPPAGKSPDVIVDPSPAAPVAQLVRLCNFPTGSATLLSSHKAELISIITKHAFEGAGGHIDCVGLSSSLGFADKSKSNQKLSEQRAFAVKTFIEEHGKKVLHGFRINVSMGLGDSNSKSDPTGNDGFFRAVEVKFFISKGGFNPFPKPKPTPKPQPVPIKPTKSFLFQAIQVTSASLALKVSGAEIDTMEFAIRDQVNQRTRYYLFIGGAASIPTPDKIDPLLKKILSLPIGVSVGRIGPQLPFITKDHITDMASFNGDASLIQKPGTSIGTKSLGGEIIFRFSPGGITDFSKSIHLEFTTSKGITTPGLGSVGKGVIVMLSTNHKPRKFPGESFL